MRFLQLFLIGILAFGGGKLGAVRVTIESLGQGNFVHLSHGSTMIFVDGGSSESSWITRRIRSERSVQVTPQTFTFREKPQELTVHIPQEAQEIFQVADKPGSQDSSNTSGKLPATVKGGAPKRSVSDRKESTSPGGSSASHETGASFKSQNRTGEGGAGTAAAAASSSTPPVFSSALVPVTPQERAGYQKSVFERVFKDIPLVNEIPTVKTVLVTHPDKDHYDAFPDLFDLEKDFSIQHLILSGTFDQYDDIFGKWVIAGWKQKKILRVICTAVTNWNIDTHIAAREQVPEAGQQIQQPLAYAQAYCSIYQNKTALEREIEAALSLVDILPQTAPEDDIMSERSSSASQTDASSAPMIQILSMNAGHATDREGNVYVANDNKNMNSIVLRISNGENALLLTGDAEGCTWNYILTAHRGRESDLRTNFFLVSHHGSKENGATRPDVLAFFKPMCCIFSAGKDDGYGHPTRDTFHMLLQYADLAYVDAHPVSYFSPDRRTNKTRIHRRHLCARALFSTLDQGWLEIDLDEEPQLTASRPHTKKYMATIAGVEPYPLMGDDAGIYVTKNGVSFDAAFQALQNALGEDADEKDTRVKVCFWEKKLNHKATLVPYRTAVQAFSPHVQHILVNPTKRRFHFLLDRQQPPLEEQAPSL